MHITRLPLVGEIAAAGRSTHGETADGVARHLVAGLVDDDRLVAGDRLAGGAGPDVVARSGDEDVQHLGRAEPVDDADPGGLAERIEDGEGQRLAG